MPSSQPDPPISALRERLAKVSSNITVVAGEHLPGSLNAVVTQARMHPVIAASASLSAFQHSTTLHEAQHARIALAIALYWWGYHQEALDWLSNVDTDHPIDSSFTQWHQMLCQRIQQRGPHISRGLMEIADVLQANGDLTGAWQCRQDAVLEWMIPAPDEAETLLRDSITYFLERERPGDACLSTLRLIFTAILHGKLDEVEGLFRQTGAHLARIHAPALRCLAAIYQGKYYAQQSAIPQALRYTERACHLAANMQHKYYRALALLDQSLFRFEQGDLTRARAVAQEALELAQSLDWLYGIATATGQQANSDLKQGDYESAREGYQTAWEITGKLEDRLHSCLLFSGS